MCALPSFIKRKFLSKWKFDFQCYFMLIKFRYIGFVNLPTAFTHKRGSKWLGCHTGHQEVSRCYTRCESEESIAQRQQSTKRGICPGLETQDRCHQKSRTCDSVAPQKAMMSSHNKETKKHKKRSLSEIYVYR